MKLGFSSPPLVRTLACALVLGLASSACVEDVGIVDRTSSDKIDKRLFEGVWLYMTTTVDVPYSSAVSFVGEQPFLGGTRKVVFDLQEDWLVAYPIIDTIAGTEADWKVNAIRKYWDPDHRDEFVEMYVGPPVARWPIDSHFDVKRAYNSYNGSQSNELTENTTDRHWYERDFVRVKWHKQGIQDFFFSLRAGGPDAYYVGEEKPGHPDEMTIDQEGGYFDFVVRSIAWSSGQSRCSIYGLSPYDCAKTEVKVRHSFRRFDPRRDYEPLRYHNDEHQDKFGFFLTEREFYSYDWGPSYAGSISYANRWNLWDKTYDFEDVLDADGEPVTCFADRDCDRDAKQRCQKNTSWFDDGVCAVPKAKPYKDRGLRPIIYHLNDTWHEDYLASAYHAADGWSDVFKDAVAWLYFYEEKGIARPRGCESHTDCETADLVADAQVTVVHDGLPCHVDSQCGSATCVSGFCASQRSCTANSPCAFGQTCQSGICMEGGQPVTDKLEVSTLGSGTIVYGDDATITTDDTWPGAMQRDLQSGSAWVRFVHLAPEAGSVSLNVNGVAIGGGDFDPNRDYDPADPATAPFMAQVPAGTGVTITALSGGTSLATSTWDIFAGQHYLVVYNGSDIISAGATFNASQRGIRGLHAAASRPAGGIDFSVEGLRMAAGVAYQTASGYFSTAGTVQRGAITRAGTRGDITCYTEDTIGQCVGWAADSGPADHDRVREIKEQLPDMFVLCENSFDPIAATETFDSEAARLEHLGDARYTRADGYNPCGDSKRVAAPESLKKVGDARYSYFYWVNEPQRSGPLGYGPSLADPETGEIIVGNANIYGGAIHTYAQYAKDLLDLVNGDLDTESVITGRWIRDWIGDQVEPDSAENATTFGAIRAGDPMGPTEEERAIFDVEHTVDHRHRLDPTMLKAKHARLQPPRRPMRETDFPELAELQADPARWAAAVEAAIPKVDPKLFHDRLGKIKGTWIEDLTITNEIKLAADHLDPTGRMSQEELRAALSPTAWASKFALKAEQERTALFARNNLYMGEFVDDALFGLAKELKAQDLTPEEFRLAVGRKILQGVLEHEVGHTIGLRHNFSGSTDVFNFFDEYFAVREQEVILCQSDSWCDDVNGAACAVKSCSADGDCPAGTICNGGACAAPSAERPNQLAATGACSMPVENSNPCTADRQCPGEGNICYQGFCYAPRVQYAPRAWMTDLEKAGKRTEYQYSTVMDYGGRVNSDVHGLGKYDYAAIRFAYTNLVDTYEDTSHIDQRISNAAEVTGSSPSIYSFYRNSRNWSNRGTGVYHAFQYLTNYIGVEQNLKRIPYPYQQVKLQRSMALSDVREYLDVAFVEVPYAFCSDEFRGNMGCYYFDQGIDMGEMAGGATDQLEQYYIFDAFKRERLYYGMYGNPMSYYYRIQDRYLRVLGDVGMYYALYDTILFRYSWYEDWKNSPLGGRTLELSALQAYDTLKDIMASPSPGSYKYDDTMQAYVNVDLESDAAGSEFNVPFGVGRFPYTQFGSDLGYNYYEHPLWFGSFWEKLAALVTLTDSTAYFVDQSVGEQLNIGVGTSLGFNTVFASDLNNFLGGIVSEELDFYAGRLIQGNYVPPSISGRMLSDTPVEPGLNNFTLKLYSALYGLAFLPAGFDPQFIDRLAVFLDGEAVQYEDDELALLQEARFSDPVGGKVYVAYSRNYGNFEDDNIDVAYNLVTKAQDLAEEWEIETDDDRRSDIQRRMGNIREVLDVLRGLHQNYGSSTLGF